MRVATHFPVFNAGGIGDMVGALTLRAQERPEALACLLLEDGEREGARLTYRELDDKARRVAAWLRERMEPGSRVIVSFPAGVEFLVALFGCFAAGMIAAPAPPLRGAAARTRLRAIAVDCQAVLALTSAGLAPAFTESIGIPAAGVEAAFDRSPARPLWRAPESIALLQYTSGSTGDPKGVIIPHRALWENEAVIRTCFGHAEGVRLVGWLPNFHDMGLVGNLLQPIYAGGLSVILPPAAFMQRPMRWLQAISRYRAHTSGAPNFAYDLCTRAASHGPPAELDLSCWQVAFNGAEPVRVSTIDAFADRFAAAGFDRRSFMPCYGLAESTLMVTGTVKGAGAAVETCDGQDVVACGEPVAGVPLIIADPESGAPAPDGAAGEILVGGDSLCNGYWGDGDGARANDALFHWRDGVRFIRTGDLGVRTPSGVCIVGRLKDVIIMNGRNIHPSDVEAEVERACASLGVTRALVAGVDAGRSQTPVLFAELARSVLRRLEPAPVADAARRAAGQDAPLAGVVLMKPGALPLTSSGKVRRRWCRDQFVAGALEGVVWRDPGAQRLIAVAPQETKA